MKRLFILGNGFDLSHGLETSYVDFKNYLEAVNFSVSLSKKDFLI